MVLPRLFGELAQTVDRQRTHWTGPLTGELCPRHESGLLTMNLENAPPGLGDLLPGWLRAPFTTPSTRADEPDSVADTPHTSAWYSAPELAPSSRMEAVIESVIDSMLESVDSLLAVVPNPVPSAGQLRQARGRGVAHLSRATHRARTPLLAGIGTADLIAEQLRRHLTLRTAPSHYASTATHQTQLDRTRPESDRAPTSSVLPTDG